MSVAIVGHQLGNMPVEVLNLGEKSCGIIVYEWNVSPVQECDR